MSCGSAAGKNPNASLLKDHSLTLFEALFRDNYERLFFFAYDLVRDREAAHDVVSDVFASLLDGGLAIRSDNARGFLLTCVRNSCINVIRHKQMRERFMKLYSNRAEPLAEGTDDSLTLSM